MFICVVGTCDDEEDDVDVRVVFCAHAMILVCPASSFDVFLLVRVSRRLFGLCSVFGRGLFLEVVGSTASEPQVFFFSSYACICAGVMSGVGGSICRASITLNCGLCACVGFRYASSHVRKGCSVTLLCM